ncbi:MAG: ABC transporter permease [Solobacterium sp.]|nr:ABC transporter permease [Solobacterium sp.]
MALVLGEDEAFREILDANGISSERYFQRTLRGVLLNSCFHNYSSGKVFKEGILGQSLHYDEAEGNPAAVEIGDFVNYDESDELFRLVPKGTIAVYALESVYYQKAVETLPEDQLTYDFFVATSEQAKVCERIYELLDAEGYRNYVVSDLSESLAAIHAVMAIIKTAMYGFTVLLTLIAMTNTVNTISTGVLLRRKEFAMYRSIGMDYSGFRKLIRPETLLYGIRALLIGIPVSLALSYLMYRTLDEKLYVFRINVPMYAAVITAVFVLVGANMVLSVNTIRDESMIETLRQDAV